MFNINKNFKFKVFFDLESGNSTITSTVSREGKMQPENEAKLFVDSIRSRGWKICDVLSKAGLNQTASSFRRMFERGFNDEPFDIKDLQKATKFLNKIDINGNAGEIVKYLNEFSSALKTNNFSELILPKEVVEIAQDIKTEKKSGIKFKPLITALGSAVMNLATPAMMFAGGLNKDAVSDLQVKQIAQELVNLDHKGKTGEVIVQGKRYQLDQIPGNSSLPEAEKVVRGTLQSQSVEIKRAPEISNYQENPSKVQRTNDGSISNINTNIEFNNLSKNDQVKNLKEKISSILSVKNQRPLTLEEGIEYNKFKNWLAQLETPAATPTQSTSVSQPKLNQTATEIMQNRQKEDPLIKAKNVREALEATLSNKDLSHDAKNYAKEEIGKLNSKIKELEARKNPDNLRTKINSILPNDKLAFVVTKTAENISTSQKIDPNSSLVQRSTPIMASDNKPLEINGVQVYQATGLNGAQILFGKSGSGEFTYIKPNSFKIEGLSDNDSEKLMSRITSPFGASADLIRQISNQQETGSIFTKEEFAKVKDISNIQISGIKIEDLLFNAKTGKNQFYIAGLANPTRDIADRFRAMGGSTKDHGTTLAVLVNSLDKQGKIQLFKQIEIWNNKPLAELTSLQKDLVIATRIAGVEPSKGYTIADDTKLKATFPLSQGKTLEYNFNLQGQVQLFLSKSPEQLAQVGNGQKVLHVGIRLKEYLATYGNPGNVFQDEGMLKSLLEDLKDVNRSSTGTGRSDNSILVSDISKLQEQLTQFKDELLPMQDVADSLNAIAKATGANQFLQIAGNGEYEVVNNLGKSVGSVNEKSASTSVSLDLPTTLLTWLTGGIGGGININDKANINIAQDAGSSTNLKTLFGEGLKSMDNGGRVIENYRLFPKEIDFLVQILGAVGKGLPLYANLSQYQEVGGRSTQLYRDQLLNSQYGSGVSAAAEILARKQDIIGLVSNSSESLDALKVVFKGKYSDADLQKALAILYIAKNKIPDSFTTNPNIQAASVSGVDLNVTKNFLDVLAAQTGHNFDPKEVFSHSKIFADSVNSLSSDARKYSNIHEVQRARLSRIGMPELIQNKLVDLTIKRQEGNIGGGYSLVKYEVGKIPGDILVSTNGKVIGAQTFGVDGNTRVAVRGAIFDSTEQVLVLIKDGKPVTGDKGEVIAYQTNCPGNDTSLLATKIEQNQIIVGLEFSCPPEAIKIPIPANINTASANTRLNEDQIFSTIFRSNEHSASSDAVSELMKNLGSAASEAVVRGPIQLKNILIEANQAGVLKTNTTDAEISGFLRSKGIQEGTEIMGIPVEQHLKEISSNPVYAKAMSQILSSVMFEEAKAIQANFNRDINLSGSYFGSSSSTALPPEITSAISAPVQTGQTTTTNVQDLANQQITTTQNTKNFETTTTTTEKNRQQNNSQSTISGTARSEMQANAAILLQTRIYSEYLKARQASNFICEPLFPILTDQLGTSRTQASMAIQATIRDQRTNTTEDTKTSTKVDKTSTTETKVDVVNKPKPPENPRIRPGNNPPIKTPDGPKPPTEIIKEPPFIPPVKGKQPTNGPAVQTIPATNGNPPPPVPTTPQGQDVKGTGTAINQAPPASQPAPLNQASPQQTPQIGGQGTTNSMPQAGGNPPTLDSNSTIKAAPEPVSGPNGLSSGTPPSQPVKANQ